jgi:hypothetical protein
MTSKHAHAAARARYLVFVAVTGAFTLLFTIVTVRYAIGGDVYETLLLSALTLGLAFSTRRWYRRWRALGEHQPPP